MTERQPLLVLDGATGTELGRRGVSTDGPAWSAPAIIRAPEVLGAIHEAHARAGADVITANTFRTQRRTLSRIGEARRAREWTLEAVRIAREAVDRAVSDRSAEHPGWPPVRVAGSVAPLEDSDRPELSPDETTARHEHGEHVGYLAEAGVDLLLVETMSTIRESRAATSVAAATGLETWTSVTMDPGGQRLASGEPLEGWIEAVAPFHPAALLVNCVSPEAGRAALTMLVAFAAESGALPGIYANPGRLDPLVGGGLHAELDPSAYEDEARAWLDAGARIVGGCCGTTPEHTGALRALVDERLAAEGESLAQADPEWQALVERAAAMAGGGRALVLTGAPGPLPARLRESLARYEVVRPSAAEFDHLPEAAFRLAILDEMPVTHPGARVLRDVARAIASGGWLVARERVEGDALVAERLGLERFEIREVAPDRASTMLLARRLP